MKYIHIVSARVHTVSRNGNELANTRSHTHTNAHISTNKQYQRKQL